MPYKDPAVRRERDRLYRAIYYQKNKTTVIGKAHERRDEAREVLRSFKASLICEGCGRGDEVRLDFHHPDPSTKDFNVADWVNRGGTLETLKEEIRKCVVLCVSCHAKEHGLRRWKERRRPLNGGG